MTTLNWRKPMADRLFSRVVKTEHCWLWTGGKDKDGYGTLKRNEGGRYRAHRISYELHHGPVPDGLLVCHSCDNPACVNPAHLWAGTSAENTLDKVKKGRAANAPPKDPCRGERHWQAKLRAIDVREIRRLVGSGHTQHGVARMYGISQGAIWAIVHGKAWRDA